MSELGSAWGYLRGGRGRYERVESSGDVRDQGSGTARGCRGVMRKFWKTGREAKHAKRGTEGRAQESVGTWGW